MQRYPYTQLQQLPARERQRLLPETQSFLRSLSRTTYIVAQLAARLPQSGWQGMLTGDSAVFTSTPTTGTAYPMPAEMRCTLIEELADSPRGDVQLRLFCHPRTMQLQYEVVISEQGDISSAITLSAPLWSVGSVAPIRLDAHAQNAVWREWASPHSAFTSLTPRGRELPKPEPLPETIRRSPLAALIRYAREYKLDLYADAYRIRPAERAARERTPDWSFETLRESVFWLHLEDDVLKACHRDYFWLRPSEIDERALAPLEAKLRQNAEISLDEWAQLAISLSPMQTARVNEMYEIAGQAVAHDTPLPLGMLVDIRPALHR